MAERQPPDEPVIDEQQQVLAPIDHLTAEQATSITTHFHEILAIEQIWIFVP